MSNLYSKQYGMKALTGKVIAKNWHRLSTKENTIIVIFSRPCKTGGLQSAS